MANLDRRGAVILGDDNAHRHRGEDWPKKCLVIWSFLFKFALLIEARYPIWWPLTQLYWRFLDLLGLLWKSLPISGLGAPLPLLSQLCFISSPYFLFHFYVYLNCRIEKFHCTFHSLSNNELIILLCVCWLQNPCFWH